MRQTNTRNTNSSGSQDLTPRQYTGRFIVYSGITKIYYRETLGHVFTKPVQMEGTTQIFFSQ